jgi:3'-phosphoadenosine 5'-phosphosulfate (PAPS) 3'-phosphatase
MMHLENRILAGFEAVIREVSSYLKRCNLREVEMEYKIGANNNREKVTRFDREIEKICVDLLGMYFPSIPVFAEEGYNHDHSRLDSQWVFIIDPIDGTSEFLRGTGNWSVSLAAVKDSKPRVGMLFMPEKKITLWAIRGRGLWDSNGEPVSYKAEAGSKNLKLAASPRQIKIPEFSSRLKQCGLNPVPIPTMTLKIVKLVLGEVDAAVYFPQQGKSANVWDYAASVLLVESIGGRITSLTGKPLPFRGNDIIHRDGWLATSKRCNHGMLLKKLAKI